jgi:hypothetical protein
MKRVVYVGHRSVGHPDGSTPDSWLGFTCGYCGVTVSGAVISHYAPNPNTHIRWLQCTYCGNPSVIDGEDKLRPGARFGPGIDGLPADVAAAYDEARDSMSVSAYTGAELVCRKILMHVAVEKGAAEGDTFASYITHLQSIGYITPPMKPWVDQIRVIGNAATHELSPPDRKRAESTVMFTAELLRLVYEMDTMIARYTP